MTDLILNAGKAFVGKNIPSWARSISTYLGGVLVALGWLATKQVDDGLQLDELFTMLGGILLVWASRFTNWVRARKLGGRSLDWVGEYLGPIAGRSVHSLIRALMTLAAGGLATIGVMQPGATPEELGAIDLSALIASLLLWVVGRIYSYLQEGKEKDGLRATPVDPSNLRP